MILKADLHIHTIASGHAFSTVNEIAAEAARKGLEAVGIADHGPALPGSPHHFYFPCLKFIPDVIGGVRIFKGVEANILGRGEVDLAESLLERLDFAIAGFHDHAGYRGETLEEHTEALVSVMQNPMIRIIAHPGNPRFPIDLERVVKTAVETGTALEINNASFIGSRHGSEGNCREIARLCARFGAPVAVSSDAHIAQAVGGLDAALEVVLEAGIPWDKIVTRDLASTLAFLGLEK
ncbi:MAG: phosphatase [Desulfuromonadaceae bacterium]|nr:phosphatase [Desulfuromonadaceae bacterium]